MVCNEESEKWALHTPMLHVRTSEKDEADIGKQVVIVADWFEILFQI